MGRKKEGLVNLELEKHLDIINTSIQNAIDKHDISFPEVIKVLVEKNIKEDKGIRIPCSILKERSLGVLEVTTKYLKEHHRFRYKEIASLLNRDSRLIWTAYNKAKQKSFRRLHIKGEGREIIWIPVSIFTDRRFGPLEAVCKHLKEQHNLSYYKIAAILGRDNRT